MMKKYWNQIKYSVISYAVTNWNSDRIFDKGKIIAIGLVIFFILWKLIYSIFV